MIAIDVGGAFGGKASIFPEELMLAVVARQLGQPVRWLATRGEDLLSGTHGRASQLQGALWMRPDGQIDALQAQLRFALGHWLPFSAAAPLNNATRILPGPYRVPAWEVQAEGRLSHAAAVGIYRGAGRPEACILMERLVDEAARQHGLDPLAVRLANVWPAAELPRELPHGVWLDRCDLRALLERAAERFDYAGRRARQRANAAQRQGQAQADSPLVGLGLALYVEPCGQGGESAQLTALPDGGYRLATGATAQGQGRETAYALLVAQALGCRAEQVEVLHGDTAQCPDRHRRAGQPQHGDRRLGRAGCGRTTEAQDRDRRIVALQRRSVRTCAARGLGVGLRDAGVAHRPRDRPTAHRKPGVGGRCWRGGLARTRARPVDRRDRARAWGRR